MKLEFFVRKKRLSCKHGGPLVGDTAGHYTVSFAFDQEWDGLVKVVVFRNGADTARLIYTGECPLPPQVSGRGELQVACHGYRSEGDEVAVVRTFRMARPLRLLASGPMAEENTEAYTPSLFSQVVAAAGEAKNAADRAEQLQQELQQKKDSGAFDGGYYIPRAGLADARTLRLDFVGSQAQMEPKLFRIPLPQQEIMLPDTMPNPYKLKLTGAVEAEYDGSEEVEVEIPAGGGSNYTLPVASSETLGGVMPVTATETMTQPVGVDEFGGLWTEPGGGEEYTTLTETVLAEGTIASGQSAYINTDTGVTIAEMVKHREIRLAIKGVSNTSNYHCLTFKSANTMHDHFSRIANSSGCAITLEHIHGLVFRVKSIEAKGTDTALSGMIGRQHGWLSVITGSTCPCYFNLAEYGETGTMKIASINPTTIDYNWAVCAYDY